MKKLLFLFGIAIALLFSAPIYASGGYHGGEHHEHYRPHYREVVKYYPRPYREVIRYYPRPQPYREVISYYPRPVPYYAAPRYYPRPQYQNYQDPRSTQGLAGGVIGSVFGYQFGGGDPLATGLGAAAGSYLGNGMSGR
ncbi:MAG: hypothetical protein Q7U57_10365 [Methylovulum sp.]|nr:hypothetical protein [Methylovulum sp.]